MTYSPQSDLYCLVAKEDERGVDCEVNGGGEGRMFFWYFHWILILFLIICCQFRLGLLDYKHMESAILKTLIYADIFDYPLKAWEIHKWLISKKKCELSEVEESLRRLVK